MTTPGARTDQPSEPSCKRGRPSVVLWDGPPLLGGIRQDALFWRRKERTMTIVLLAIDLGKAVGSVL
ncbi:hypothetical protein SH611_22965, partial [Geminicoccaceae bacterium 1502E]|nr:hypothetical protein [Geminicoccaceae bacterium 1502E]